MKVENTNLEGVLIIDPPTNFQDFRGSYVETYNERLYKENGITQNFIQDDISTSKFNVLRGIHGDASTTKLVSCTYGKFFLVVVNNNPVSPQYKQWQSFYLSDLNRKQVLIPPMYGMVIWYYQNLPFFTTNKRLSIIEMVNLQLYGMIQNTILNGR